MREDAPKAANDVIAKLEELQDDFALLRVELIKTQRALRKTKAVVA